MRRPPVRHISRADTHRLIPSKHLPRGDSVFTRIADDDEHLAAIFELDDATNERLLAERGRPPASDPRNSSPQCPTRRSSTLRSVIRIRLDRASTAPSAEHGMPPTSSRPRRPRWRFTRAWN